MHLINILKKTIASLSTNSVKWIYLLKWPTHSFCSSDFLAIHNSKCPADSTDVENQVTDERSSCKLKWALQLNASRYNCCHKYSSSWIVQEIQKCIKGDEIILAQFLLIFKSLDVIYLLALCKTQSAGWRIAKRIKSAWDVCSYSTFHLQTVT